MPFSVKLNKTYHFVCFVKHSVADWRWQVGRSICDNHAGRILGKGVCDGSAVNG